MGPSFNAMTVTSSPAPGNDTDLPDLDLFRYLVCVVDSERDPDMSGFAVRLSGTSLQSEQHETCIHAQFFRLVSFRKRAYLFLGDQCSSVQLFSGIGYAIRRR